MSLTADRDNAGGESMKWRQPCWTLGYCPYGVLAKEFARIPEETTNCGVFGHSCPVFAVAEDYVDKEPYDLTRGG